MTEYYHRHLPHWHPQGAVFFITFRLKDTMPIRVIEALQEERDLARHAMRNLPASERLHRNKLDEQHYFDRWDEYLGKAEFGPRWLSQPEIAGIVKDALHYRDGKVFDLHAYCIMANHVHVVFEPVGYPGLYSLSDKSGILPGHRTEITKIMHSLKSRTAHQANILLNRQGAFWMDESYDRVIRDSEEYLRTIAYVLENPVKARLVPRWDDWQWSYHKHQ